ncbi:MAG: glutamate 5-kinase, partial [Eggerthellaceae bacterium]|nr:glutamate 5-kinase [Eggerthellaceae bacterium]
MSVQQAQRKSPVAIIKLGSATLADAQGRLDRQYLARLAHQVHTVRQQGWKVVLVSSGAISCGLDELGLPLERPKEMPLVQAAASVGQRVLSAAYDEVFSQYGIITSLVLLTRRDTAHRRAYLHARDTFNTLLDLNVVPIVNENDTVTLENIRFGDNDSLAALVGCLINANRVVILSDIDGLYPENPANNPQAKLISHVEAITPEIMDAAQGPGSKVGSGGMITKIRAARVLYSAGIPMVVCHGRAEHAVELALREKPEIGTYFAATSTPHEITQKK